MRTGSSCSGSDLFSPSEPDLGRSTTSIYIALLTNHAFTGRTTALACATQKRRLLNHAPKPSKPRLQKKAKSSNLDPRSNPLIHRFQWPHYGENAPRPYAER